MAKKYKCQICSSSEVFLFFELVSIPAHIGILWANKDEAMNCPRGDIKLTYCKRCGFIYNVAFDPTLLEYKQTYDNSLDYSPFYQEYALSLAKRLINRYNLRNKSIIEVGCGKGNFLRLICKLGNNTGVGFDPSYEDKFSDSEGINRITFIKDFYSEKYADYKADLICCRCVFEHIHNPSDFLTTLRYTIGEHTDTILYFEVPNVLFILRDLSIWDIIYEHCSYFSRNSLSHVFTSCRFDIFDNQEVYDGQYVGIEAFPSDGPVNQENNSWNDHKQLTRYVQALNSNYREKIETWQRKLERIKQAGQKAVAWGAGAKAVSFFNMLKIKGRKGLEYIVDINSSKQGTYIAGTGHLIVPPEFLRGYKPDVVIIMNQIYKNEIHQTIKELGLAPTFLYA